MTSPLRHEMRQLIVDGAARQTRSLQKRIGPSEVGAGCDKQIALKLYGAPKVNTGGDPLPSIVGTGAHAELEKFVQRANGSLGRTRYLPEFPVEVRPGLAGTSDLIDLDDKHVWDWKGLALTTPIPTPTGWSTIGHLSIGDAVFAADGTRCTVTDKSPIFTDRDCYRIAFDDGTDVIADNVHLWNIIQDARSTPRTVSTDELFAIVNAGRHARIVNAAPLDLPDADLPITPYTLGAWLGDGDSHGGRIGKPDDELFDHIASEGWEIGDRHGVTRNIHGLRTKLREANLYRNKHLPEAYLRGSVNQRLALLQGLMDTDGTWNRKRNQAVFTTVRKDLAHSVAELVTTLGWKPHVWELTRRGFGKEVTAYDVTFTPYDRNPFHLSRKADLVRIDGPTKSRRRYVKSVTRTATVSTQCITVDSSDETFLCGEQMVPTHNCPSTSRLAHYRRNGPSKVYRTQAHLYGRGARNAGLPIEHVGIIFLPRGGMLADAQEWSEPYDDQIVDDALARLDDLQAVADTIDADPAILDALAVDADDCWFCDFRSSTPTSPLQCAGANPKPDAITRLAS